jgi:hypothetical protein
MSMRSTSLLLLFTLVFAVTAGGCNSGHRFGGQFGDPPVTEPPPPPPEPDCISPVLNNVVPVPVQGAAGSTLTLDGVNFNPVLEGNRVLFRSFSNQTILEGYISNINVDTTPPTGACGNPSFLTVVVPSGVRSGTIELFVSGVFAGADVFTAAPEIVGFAVGEDGDSVLVSDGAVFLPTDVVVIYGYNLSNVTSANIDDGSTVTPSPSVQSGAGNVNYDLPGDMEAVRVELTPFALSGDTSPLGISLTAATAALPLVSSEIQLPAATPQGPGEWSAIPPYTVAGLMPGGIRAGNIPLQFVIVGDPVRGRFDAIPEFENPIGSDNWEPCTAIEDTFDGQGMVPTGFGFVGAAPFAVAPGQKMTYQWDSSADLPDGMTITKIRLQLGDPVPATAAQSEPGIWTSGPMVINNTLGGNAAGSIDEDFESLTNYDPTAGGAVWGGGLLEFNAVAPEVSGALSVGSCIDPFCYDVILQADRTYDMNSLNGSIYDVTDDPPIEILPAGPVPGEFQMRTFAMEAGAIVQLSGPVDLPVILRCSGTGNPEDIVCLLAGTLDLSGADGFEGVSAMGGDGGSAGPGGGAGGTGATMEVNVTTQTIDSVTPSTSGEFGGGGGGSLDLVIPAAIYTTRAGNAGGGGGGVRGGDGINTFSFNLSNRAENGSGGFPTTDSLGIQLNGGGGGGGGGAGTRRPTTTASPVVNNGGGGGGGGGALGIVADGSVRITGTIVLNGGNGQRGVQGTTAGAGGGGGGGSIVVRASGDLEVGATASIQAIGGFGGIQLESPNGSQIQKGGTGGDGLVRFEANGSMVFPGTLDESALLPPVGVGMGTSYGVSSGTIEVGNGIIAMLLTAGDSPYLADTDAGTITNGSGSLIYDNGVDGVFEFGSIQIDELALLIGVGSNSLFLRSSGGAEISGVIDVSGLSGGIPDLSDPVNPVPAAGGDAGAGGGAGGGGGLAQLGALNDGEDGSIPAGVPPELIYTGVPPGGDPGGTIPPDMIAAATGGEAAEGPISCTVGGGGGGGYADEGSDGSGAGACTDPEFPAAGQGGSAYGAASFIVPDPTTPGASLPLHVGGLGGGGGGALFDTDTSTSIPGTGGGGGGGYIEITANGPMNINSTAGIFAVGGSAYRAPIGAAAGGAGAGGAIRVRGRSVVNVAAGAQLDASGGFANQPIPGSPYPTDGSNTGGSGAEGWVRVETPLGFSDTGIDVVPAPSIGTFSLFGSSLSSAASTPYNLVSDDGSSYTNLVVQTATTTLLSGSPANIQILYEGYGISDVASGQIGPLLGIVADPEELLNPQSIVVRFFLYLDPGNIGFTPQVDSVSIGFDEAPPTP